MFLLFLLFFIKKKKINKKKKLGGEDADMGRQLHSSGRQDNTIRILSLIRQDVEKNYNRPNDKATPSGHNPYYGNCIQQKCNRPDAMATSSRRGPNMVLHGARYGKSIAQLSV